MKCPHCGSKEVFHSARGNARLPWLWRPFVTSIRCYTCQRRFLTRSAWALGARAQQPRGMKTSRRAA